MHSVFFIVEDGMTIDFMENMIKFLRKEKVYLKPLKDGQVISVKEEK